MAHQHLISILLYQLYLIYIIFFQSQQACAYLWPIYLTFQSQHVYVHL